MTKVQGTMPSETELTCIRPDDWHLHLRDGRMLRTILPVTAEQFGRALIMPNLQPPVRTLQEAEAYRQRILECLPQGLDFQPLMTLYLTDETKAETIYCSRAKEWLAAVKMYPCGATTNSELGVTHIKGVYPILEVLQKLGLPLSVHGEVSDPEVDVFDREAVFIDRVLEPLRRDFPELKVVLEHVSSRIGVDYVLSVAKNLAATITPHHLLLNRNSLFRGGFNPHFFCLPVAKREADRQAVRQAAVSGDPRFFFGSDSAPHWTRDKEKTGGAGGIFNSPTALSVLAHIFEKASALDKLEAFLSLHGASFYERSPNQGFIVLQKAASPLPVAEFIAVGEDRIKIFEGEAKHAWQVVRSGHHKSFLGR